MTSKSWLTYLGVFLLQFRQSLNQLIGMLLLLLGHRDIRNRLDLASDLCQLFPELKDGIL